MRLLVWSHLKPMLASSWQQVKSSTTSSSLVLLSQGSPNFMLTHRPGKSFLHFWYMHSVQSFVGSNEHLIRAWDILSWKKCKSPSQTLNIFYHFYAISRREKNWLTGQTSQLEFSLTLHAPVEKNNAWPTNRLLIDLPAWFLAGAHGQKWTRAGPHDTDTGVSNSTPPVIHV